MHAYAPARGFRKPRHALGGHILNLRTRGVGDRMIKGEIHAQEREGEAGFFACGDELSMKGTQARQVGGYEAPDIYGDSTPWSVSREQCLRHCVW